MINFFLNMNNSLIKFFNNDLKYDISKLKNVFILNKENMLEKYSLKDLIPFIGCFKIVKNNIIVDYKLVVPQINNIETLLINIHEYGHAIKINENINNEDYDDIFDEVIPITLERIYIDKYNHEYLKIFNKIQLEKLERYLKNINIYQKYLLAFYYQFELYDKYKNNLQDILNDNLDFNILNRYNNIEKLLKK